MMPTLVGIVSFLFQAYQFAILIRVLLTWVNVNPYRPAIDHPVVQVLYRITDPVLEPLRRVIPPIRGTFDISPIVALFILEILRRIVTDLLMRL